MPINNINEIIDIGLNTICHGIPMVFRNQSNSFRFDNDVFYSYNEPIANKVIIDNQLFFNVYGKTAKYGYYFSQTTSQHISKVLQALNTSEFWKNKHNIIDINGNVITDKKDKGKRIIEEIECPICLDIFDEGLELRCKHKFCKKCIKKWIKDHNDCPYCKQSLFY